MANGNLTRKERQGIENDIRMVLQRPREFFKCPLDLPDMINLWESLFEPQAIHAYRMLRGYPQHISSPQLASTHARICVRIGEREAFQFHMGSGNYSSLVFCDSRKLQGVAVGPMSVAQVVGDDKAAALIPWMRQIVSFSTQAAVSMLTLASVLKLPSTAGQLARMIPEIVPFLSDEKQIACQSQQKASALPAEWAAYDREPVQAMMVHIAKCGLLPPTVRGGPDKNPLGYTDFDTWAELLPT